MKDYLKDKRVVEAMLLTLFPILLYGIIGPLEIYAGNTNEFIFILKDFFGYFVILSVILWLIASLVLILLPKKNIKCIAGNRIYVFLAVLSAEYVF